jgi:hypothetical protein
MSAAHRSHRTGLFLLLLATLLLVAPGARAAGAGSPGPRAFDPLGALGTVPAQLVAPDGAADDWFGNSVAISGDTLFVGAYRDDVGDLVDRGSVYVYERVGDVWMLRQHLFAPEAEVVSEFGCWLDVDGDTALVGATYVAAGPSTSPGSAYVFARSGPGAEWFLQTKLVDPDDAADPSFGTAVVALSGGTALVGAPSDDVAGVDQGSVAVYVRSGASWTFQGRLIAADGEADDLFGIRVAISGDTALVAAQMDDVGSSVDQGSAYVFVRNGTTWSPQAKLVATDGEAGDRFGLGVELSGDTALVGCFGDDLGKGPEQGSAYVFTRSGTAWSQQARLVASDGAADDEFGVSLAVDDDAAVIGAWQHDVGVAADTGSAYVFTRSGGRWGQQHILAPAAPGDHFGREVTLAGDVLVVAAELATIAGHAYQGAVYIYHDAAAPVTTARVVPAPNAAGWNREPVTVELAAADDFMGVARIDVLLMGAPTWTTYTGALGFTGPGTYVTQYRAVDYAGRTEATKTLTVRLDMFRPTTEANRSVSVRRGGYASLRYRVMDGQPTCGKANVTLRIRRASGGPWVKIMRLGVKAANQVLSYRFRCRLKPARYRYFVYAEDIAGNVQSSIGRNTLRVR